MIKTLLNIVEESDQNINHDNDDVMEISMEILGKQTTYTVPGGGGRHAVLIHGRQMVI